MGDYSPLFYMDVITFPCLNPKVGKRSPWFNSSPSEQNDHHFADDIFKYIFVNEMFCILINISLKFVPKGQISNILVLVQKMAWSLIEPMLIRFTDTYMWHWGDDLNYIVLNCSILSQISLTFGPMGPINIRSTLVHTMTWHLLAIMPLPKPVLTKTPGAVWHHKVTMN